MATLVLRGLGDTTSLVEESSDSREEVAARDGESVVYI